MQCGIVEKRLAIVIDGINAGIAKLAVHTHTHILFCHFARAQCADAKKRRRHAAHTAREHFYILCACVCFVPPAYSERFFGALSRSVLLFVPNPHCTSGSGARIRIVTGHAAQSRRVCRVEHKFGNRTPRCRCVRGAARAGTARITHINVQFNYSAVYLCHCCIAWIYSKNSLGIAALCGCATFVASVFCLFDS